jgi:hypothetical protein
VQTSSHSLTSQLPPFAGAPAFSLQLSRMAPGMAGALQPGGKSGGGAAQEGAAMYAMKHRLKEYFVARNTDMVPSGGGRQ